MNASDWVQMTGHPLVGRGGRPINPIYLATKAPRKMISASFARAARQTLLRAAQISGEVDALLPFVATQQRRRVRDTTIAQQSMPGAAGQRAMLQHTRAVQLARR